MAVFKTYKLPNIKANYTMHDFTLKIYHQLLLALKKRNYTFLPFEEYIQSRHGGQAYNLSRRNEVKPEHSIIILRHDVDDLKLNSLRFAKIQNELGIKGTYYFRVVPQSYDEQVISEIANLGHEIGYHYEDVDIAHRQFKIQNSKFRMNEEEIIDAAWESFKSNLEIMRKVADVKTICMHGSPRSKYDNKDIWKKFDYRELGIIGEPYLDIDFNEVLYLTDTGRRWDGYKVSIRDKVSNQQKKWEEQGLVFHTTQDIINALRGNRLPSKIMMTFHPQRWHNKSVPWVKELVMQNIKNVVKKVIVSTKN